MSFITPLVPFAERWIITMNKILFIIIPCYNEEEVLLETAQRLKVKLETLIDTQKVSSESKIVFINDGSKDNTWNIIQDLNKTHQIYRGINLSRNCGHQNALMAGLISSYKIADMVISMDADLQDDINAIDEMIDCYYNGADIVYGVRNSRKKDHLFKRFTAESFYKIMLYMGAEIIFNHADYRLMSKRAIESLTKFQEVNLFLRGIIPMLGYKTDIVYYERGERFAGQTKYPLKKMLAFAFEGISSLSTKPIKIILELGIIIILNVLLILFYSIIRYPLRKTTLQKTNHSIIVSVWAIGGLILLSIGIVGEYIGKIYLETKHRPRFIIEDILD